MVINNFKYVIKKLFETLVNFSLGKIEFIDIN